MSAIFVSYRRDDSRDAAGRLVDDLRERFGHDAVFRDIQSVSPGEDFEKALDRALDSVVVLLALIGPKWATIRRDRARRLDDPNDWTRREIARALERGIRVIPLLLEDTPLPSDGQLPPELKPLLKRQAKELTDLHWRNDVASLIETLSAIPQIRGLSPAPRPSPRIGVRLPRAAAILLLLLGVLVLLSSIIPVPGPGERQSALMRVLKGPNPPSRLPDLTGDWIDRGMSWKWQLKQNRTRIDITIYAGYLGSGLFHTNGTGEILDRLVYFELAEGGKGRLEISKDGQHLTGKYDKGERIWLDRVKEEAR